MHVVLDCGTTNDAVVYVSLCVLSPRQHIGELLSGGVGLSLCKLAAGMRHTWAWVWTTKVEGGVNTHLSDCRYARKCRQS